MATRLRIEITQGHLAPGDRIVEAHWASLLGVAQASVREAINTLIHDGYIEKSSGRSARVTSLSPTDIKQIYQLRAAMEGLNQALDSMREAAASEGLQSFYTHDLEFHIALCDCSGNRFLGQQVRNLLFKLFAFYVMGLQDFRDNKHYWSRSIAEHEQIIAVVKRGHPGLAEQHLVATIEQFFVETQSTDKQGGIIPC